MKTNTKSKLILSLIEQSVQEFLRQTVGAYIVPRFIKAHPPCFVHLVIEAEFGAALDVTGEVEHQGVARGKVL